MSRIFRILWISLLITAPRFATAEGSLALEDILPLLAQQPELKAHLERTLDLDSVATGGRIGNRMNPDFGGTPVAPYEIRVKPKGQAGPFTMLLTVEAETRFLDEKGVETELAKARSLEEKLESVGLRQLRPDESTGSE